MEHLSVEKLNGYRTGKLAGKELLDVDDHLAECEICSLRLKAQAAVEYSHVPYDLLETYVGGAMPSDQMAELEKHLNVCPPCREEARDLKSWAAELSRRQPARNVFKRTLIYGAIAATLLLASVVAWRTQTRSQLVVALHNGGSMVGLDSAGQLRESESISLSLADQSVLTSLLRSGNLKVQIDPDIQGRQSKLLGGEEQGSRFRLFSPVGYSVDETTPQLQWLALPNSVSYQASIFDSNYKLVETSPVLQKNEWVVTTPLERGKIYTWQVLASTNQEKIVAPRAPDAEARFRVISADEAVAVDSLRRQSASNHLLLAARFAAFGLCKETLAELNALRAENPDSPLAARLDASAKSSCPVHPPQY